MFTIRKFTSQTRAQADAHLQQLVDRGVVQIFTASPSTSQAARPAQDQVTAQHADVGLPVDSNLAKFKAAIRLPGRQSQAAAETQPTQRAGEGAASNKEKFCRGINLPGRRKSA